METVLWQHEKVRLAIKFVESQIKLSLELAPEAYCCSFDKIPWIWFTPAESLVDKYERTELIERYKRSKRDHITYYLLYHNCYDFAVFHWACLSAQNISAHIACQSTPFSHCYLIVDAVHVDMLAKYCDFEYPYDVEKAEKFATPREMYEKTFIEQDDRAQWEIDLLEQLKSLE